MSEEVTEPAVEPPKENTELKDMMTKLDELGITNVEQLQKKATAASEAGNLANMVGDLRSEIAELKSNPAPPVPVATTEYDEGGIDIETAIGSAVGKELDKRAESARKVQLARANEAQAIRSNEHYKVVGQEFEAFMASPQGKGRLASGETPTKIFGEMANWKYRKMLQETAAAASAAQGDPSATAVPYVESDQTPPPVMTTADEQKTKIKNIRENWSGNDEDIDKALAALLPSGSLPLPK